MVEVCHICDIAGCRHIRERVDMPPVPEDFSVFRQNNGHWDVVNSNEGRLFRLRGGPGEWRVFDERKNCLENIPAFKEQSAAMAFICTELMHELLMIEGQKPYVMESWNVTAKIGGMP